ncbi:MAG TPA: hypothetical protein VFK40_06240 [Nitrososphaeraceae archaeon]|nr:hypothetical protein [Nitrososphaeraceae archaeon]
MTRQRKGKDNGKHHHLISITDTGPDKGIIYDAGDSVQSCYNLPRILSYLDINTDRGCGI